jgi:hypothetical protein
MSEPLICLIFGFVGGVVMGGFFSISYTSVLIRKDKEEMLKREESIIQGMKDMEAIVLHPGERRTFSIKASES